MAFNYDGCTETDPSKVEKLIAIEADGSHTVNFPIRYKMRKPKGADGNERDQTEDAARNMRYAASLGLPELKVRMTPRMGRAIIVGGAPSIAGHIEEIRRLAADPDNAVFAINKSHTWLINNGIVPKACVFFEIDAEPETVLKAAHDGVTYFICSHCDRKTFDDLKEFKRVLWHCPPNSDAEKVVAEELFKTSHHVGGGVGTFLRSISVGLFLGFRSFDLFGCDGSFPDESESTHVKGYETENDVKKDSFFVYPRQKMPDGTNKVRRFKTVGYLALQIDEFKEYCRINHWHFACRVHGDSLLRFAHENYFPDQYKTDLFFEYDIAAVPGAGFVQPKGTAA